MLPTLGVAAVLALNPDGSSATVSTHSVASTLPSTSGSSAGVTPQGSGTGTTKGSGTGTSNQPAPGGSSASSATKGSAVDVGYGIVQVQVTLSGGKITDISALQLPQNDRHSARISDQAWPMLVQQAITAQSSQISGISGASYTSYGFVESLKAALLAAGHAA